MDKFDQMMKENKEKREKEKQYENRILTVFFSVEILICIGIVLWTRYWR